MTDDLVAFLRARYDETAAKAHAAAAELGPDWYYDDGYVMARREGDQVVTGSQDYLERERGEHIARHDPARVLAEVDAKRRIVEASAADCPPGCQAEHSFSGSCALRAMGPAWEESGERWVRDEDGNPVHAPHTPLSVLRSLALPDADHPDYREEWRP